MRFAAVLAISLLGVSSALGQSAPVSEAPSAATQTASADTPPVHPITREQVHEIMVLTDANRLSGQSVRAVLDQVEKSFPPYVPQDVITDLNNRLENFNYEPLAIEAYRKHVSTEDAARIIAFYRSAAGRRLIAVTPQIMREMQEQSAKEGERIVQEVIHQHMDEINAARKQYMQEHSGQPKIITPN